MENLQTLQTLQELVEEQYFYEHQCYDRKSWFCDKMKDEGKNPGQSSKYGSHFQSFYTFIFFQPTLLLQSIHF